jgi:hypothetical protein
MLAKEEEESARALLNGILPARLRNPLTGPGLFLNVEYAQIRPLSRQREHVGRIMSPTWV